MNKKIVFSITALLLAILAIGVYFIPKIIENKNAETQQKIKDVNMVFTNKILEEYNLNPNIKASEAAQKVCDELNEVTKNPYDNKSLAYTFTTNCKGCSSVEYDNKLNMIVVTTLDNEGALISRTVIKPPSFVTYSKNENEKEGDK